jgi:hypothetical protein
MVWKRLAARGGEKIPERAAIETRDIDLESAADPAGCRHRVLSGPAIPRPARASHGPWPPTPSPLHRDRASADRHPFRPGTPALPQENVCTGLPRYLWRYLPIKGACFRPEAGQSR